MIDHTYPLRGVVRLSRARHADGRGYLTEVSRDEHLQALGLVGLPEAGFVQDNHAHSVRHTVRGLHWQLGLPQGKLITVMTGAIVDVVADVCPVSPTFGQWVAVPLDAAQGHQLWVPPGYAHGFCVVSERADVLYKNTAPYRGPQGRGVHWRCPTLGVQWPCAVGVLSDKDAALPGLADLARHDLPSVAEAAWLTG